MANKEAILTPNIYTADNDVVIKFELPAELKEQTELLKRYMVYTADKWRNAGGEGFDGMFDRVSRSGLFMAQKKSSSTEEVTTTAVFGDVPEAIANSFLGDLNIVVFDKVKHLIQNLVNRLETARRLEKPSGNKVWNRQANIAPRILMSKPQVWPPRPERSQMP
ncbi:hypothetical protein BC936DRAFT_148484 [Jimgerdemannia flammicorona]|uniref:Uncharacterized protein n=1 Tax=Jimgerdemannia flammicorona TaxID=994334 RepID=A0A433D2Y1_9FUNG|nr:hypothetical protein BC936DRAFT_148484 [Jimgerdemannia flammicorona]